MLNDKQLLLKVASTLIKVQFAIFILFAIDLIILAAIIMNN